jgi:hypothetical protein
VALNADGYRRWNVNTFLDTQLTSVATQQASTATLQSFNQSQKAASFQIGTYVPWIMGSPWARGSNRYSLFIAPMGKAGLVTLTDEQSASATVPVTDRFFKAYSYGARLGVFQHYHSSGAAPSIVSYVDITTGRFGDFEAFRELTPATAGAPGEIQRVRPWRYSFEGLLKLPSSPFVVGFSANIGTGAWPAFKDAQGIFHPYTQPRDDLRFLLGAQFDFSKLLKALPQF